MKPKILLLLVLSALAVSCVSSKLTIQNMDDKAPDLVLKNGVFLISELSHDPRYGYDKNYPINLFYKSTANDSINQPRFLDALAGPKGEKISYRKVETCCPFPIGRSDMGAGTMDVFEIVWPGQTKPVRLYLNIYGKGYLRVPMGFSLKKPKD